MQTHLSIVYYWQLISVIVKCTYLLIFFIFFKSQKKLEIQKYKNLYIICLVIVALSEVLFTCQGNQHIVYDTSHASTMQQLTFCRQHVFIVKCPFVGLGCSFSL